MKTQQTLFENAAEFKAFILSAPSGTKFTRVKTFNDSGSLVGLEHTINHDKDIEDMLVVANGYVTETTKMRRK